MDIFFGYGYLGKHLFNPDEIKVCKNLNEIKSFVNENKVENLWYFASPQDLETISKKKV